MGKIFGWIVLIVGLLLVLALIIPGTFASALDAGNWVDWVVAILVLIAGIVKVAVK